jgi:hypothetical protein
LAQKWLEREVKTEMKKKQKRKEERMLDFELIRPVEPRVSADALVEPQRTRLRHILE